jgi:hypothetical protein
VILTCPDARDGGIPDAKIIQIIEGSDQISQLTVCAAGLPQYGRECAA